MKCVEKAGEVWRYDKCHSKIIGLGEPLAETRGFRHRAFSDQGALQPIDDQGHLLPSAGKEC